jgi:hypothetical protein
VNEGASEEPKTGTTGLCDRAEVGLAVSRSARLSEMLVKTLHSRNQIMYIK